MVPFLYTHIMKENLLSFHTSPWKNNGAWWCQNFLMLDSGCIIISPFKWGLWTASILCYFMRAWAVKIWDPACSWTFCFYLLCLYHLFFFFHLWLTHLLVSQACSFKWVLQIRLGRFGEISGVEGALWQFTAKLPAYGLKRQFAHEIIQACAQTVLG